MKYETPLVHVVNISNLPKNGSEEIVSEREDSHCYHSTWWRLTFHYLRMLYIWLDWAGIYLPMRFFKIDSKKRIISFCFYFYYAKRFPTLFPIHQMHIDSTSFFHSVFLHFFRIKTFVMVYWQYRIVILLLSSTHFLRHFFFSLYCFHILLWRIFFFLPSRPLQKKVTFFCCYHKTVHLLPVDWMN